jgi:hypothetical protein
MIDIDLRGLSKDLRHPIFFFGALKVFSLMLNYIKHTKIAFVHFPGSFLCLGRSVWTNDHLVKDCSRVTFPVIFDMDSYALLTKNYYLYQMAASIHHPAISRTIKIITRRSSEYSADGFE